MRFDLRNFHYYNIGKVKYGTDSGLKHTMEVYMKTLSKIFKEAVETYLLSVDVDNPPKPSDTEEQLLDLMYSFVSHENASRSKGNKLSYPKVLPNPVITDLILALHPVCKVPFALTDAHKNCDLCVYMSEGEHAGIYMNDPATLDALVRQYNYNASTRDVREVINALFAKAPLREKCSDENLVAVNNGIFNYKNKVLLDFSPDFVFLSKSYVDYNPNAKNIVIHNYNDNTDWDVESWMSSLSDDDEVVKVLWEILSAIIRPNVRWNKAISFVGPQGCGGKSTLMVLMRELCGANSSATIPFSNFGKEFALEPLLHCSAVLTDEIPVRSYAKEVDTFKLLLTGEPVYLSRKGEKNITAKLNVVMVFALNSMVSFGDKSESLVRRLLFVPMTKCFTGKERKYIKSDYLKRKEVLEYVLFKVLNTDFYTLSEPKACKALIDEFREYNNTVREFLKEILPQIENPFVPYSLLFNIYVEWLRRNSPSSVCIGKKSFIAEVREVISNNPDWQAKDTPIPKRNLLDIVEPIVIEYGISWRADKTSYTGLMKVRSSP